jgi:hypothetical protein
MDRVTVRQKKTGRPVTFELTDQTRQAIDDYVRLIGTKAGQFLYGRVDLLDAMPHIPDIVAGALRAADREQLCCSAPFKQMR